MSWLIEDRFGEVHEIGEDERALIVGPNESYSRNWLLDQHLPPFGGQFTVPQSNQVIGTGTWRVVVWLSGWEANPNAQAIEAVAQKVIKLRGAREIWA